MRRRSPRSGSQIEVHLKPQLAQCSNVRIWPSYFILRRTSYSLALARSYSSLSRRAASAPLRALTHMPWQGCSHSTVPHAALSPLAARTAAPHTHTGTLVAGARTHADTPHSRKSHLRFTSLHTRTHAQTWLWPSRSTTKPSSFFCPFLFYFQAASAAFAGGASVIRSDETSVFASSFSVT